MQNDPLVRLQKLAEVAGEGFASVQDVAHGFAAIVDAVREYVQPLFDRLDKAEGAAKDLLQQLSNIKLTPGPTGPQGPKGDTVVGPRGPAAQDGKDGNDGKDGSPDTPVEIRTKLESLRGQERLHISALDGVDELRGTVEARPKRNIFGIPSRGMFLYVAGVKKGIISNLNVVGAGGATVAYSKVNGQDTLTITATGGGITVETPTGAVNASNTQFTPTAQPKWVVADGTTYYENAGYTWDGTHINMSMAPSEFIRDII